MQLICFDKETTSAEPKSCRVVQFGAVAFTEDSEEVLYNEICDPGLDEGFETTPEAEAIHGITREQMVGKRRDTIVLGEFYDFIAPHVEGLTFAGHNIARFDFPILYRVGERTPLSKPRVIDTLTLVQRYPIEGCIDGKLGTVTKHLGLGDAELAHDAVGDCRMVYQLVQYFARGLGKTWEELAAECAVPRVHIKCGFGKHKGKFWGNKSSHPEGTEVVPWFYVDWMIKNFSDASPDMVMTIYHHYGRRMKGFDEVLAMLNAS